MTIPVEVKTVWQGQVGIRDKYVDEARQLKESLLIGVGNERMLIRFDELEDKIASVSDFPFIDKFSNKKHYLYYFEWKPIAKQGCLL